jgi:hypothetical protein
MRFIMINPIPTQRVQKRYKPRVAAQAATPPVPGVPLNLVSAQYQVDPAIVLLMVFDRAVDISAFNGAAIELDDGDVNSQVYSGASASLVDEVTVQVTLAAEGSESNSGIYLYGTGGSGIVAVDDGGTWVGVIGLALEIPPHLQMEKPAAKAA